MRMVILQFSKSPLQAFNVNQCPMRPAPESSTEHEVLKVSVPRPRCPKHQRHGIRSSRAEASGESPVSGCDDRSRIQLFWNVLLSASANSFTSGESSSFLPEPISLTRARQLVSPLVIGVNIACLIFWRVSSRRSSIDLVFPARRESPPLWERMPSSGSKPRSPSSMVMAAWSLQCISRSRSDRYFLEWETQKHHPVCSGSSGAR